MKLLTILIALLALAGPLGLFITQPGDDFGVEWDQRSDRSAMPHAAAPPVRIASR